MQTQIAQLHRCTNRSGVSCGAVIGQQSGGYRVFSAGLASVIWSIASNGIQHGWEYHISDGTACKR
eukprot:7977673-Ditylum_brightwellii.AAC.1